MPAAVGEFRVDLVRNDQKIVLFDDGKDGFQLLLCHDAARGIVGVRQDERLGFGGDGALQLRGREDETVLLHAGNGDGNAPRKLHAGRVGNVAGVGHEDLVARLAHRAHDEVDALARPHRDDDVFGRIVHGKPLGKIARDQLAQGGKPAVARVLRVSALDGFDRRVADVPRRDEVRLAHAQGNGVLHFRHDIEKFTDAAGFEPRRTLIDKISHACTDMRMRLSSSVSVMVPSILYFLRMKCVAVDCTSSSVERRSETKRATSRRFLPSMNTARS